MSTSSIVLETVKVTKRFGDFVAVDEVSLAIPSGSFFSILGPSGCGKTTLMRMIAGFLEPTSGDIFINGKSVLDVPPNHRPVNMVFQHLALFPMMSVADNIAYGLRRRSVPKSEIAQKVREILDRVGLPDAGPKQINQLSGGQKQRIAIARCLVLTPDVLLLDEPLGALDLKLREHMKVELKQLQHEFGTTFVYITHDQSEALVMSDQVAVMNAGRFDQVGSPQELYFDPKTAFVAGFVGDTNRWSGRIDTVDAGTLQLVSNDGFRLLGHMASGQSLQPGAPADIFVRPEAIIIAREAGQLGDIANRMSGRVTSVLFNGANSRIIVHDSASDSEIFAALPQTGEFSDLSKGQEVHLGWSADKAVVFASRNHDRN